MIGRLYLSAVPLLFAVLSFTIAVMLESPFLIGGTLTRGAWACAAVGWMVLTVRRYDVVVRAFIAGMTGAACALRCTALVFFDDALPGRVVVRQVALYTFIAAAVLTMMARDRRRRDLWRGKGSSQA